MAENKNITRLNVDNVAYDIALSDESKLPAVGADYGGSIGPTFNVTGNNDATIRIPYITVDKYGRVVNMNEYVYTSKNTTYSSITNQFIEELF